jgi:hypothetical protein
MMTKDEILKRRQQLIEDRERLVRQIEQATAQMHRLEGAVAFIDQQLAEEQPVTNGQVEAGIET